MIVFWHWKEESAINPTEKENHRKVTPPPFKRDNCMELLQIKVQEAVSLVKSRHGSKYFIIDLDNSKYVI
jgi:hypothetical protein